MRAVTYTALSHVLKAFDHVKSQHWGYLVLE